MKQIGIWVISLVCIVSLNTARAEDGETIFKAQGCMSCHKTESTAKVNPSLADFLLRPQ
jgi:cytochrome c551/c552